MEAGDSNGTLSFIGRSDTPLFLGRTEPLATNATSFSFFKICRSIDEGERCVAYDVKYLPYTKGQPMIEQEINYFVPFPDIVSRMVPTFLFYTELEITAVLAPKEVAPILGCSETEPLLLLRRRFMDQDRLCIGYGERYQRQGAQSGTITARSGYQTQPG